jgi:hypothetical protein
MFLRRAVLALGSLALVASLAACDLPGGTPPTLGPDVAPNDNPESAPRVYVPGLIRGSNDPDDLSDYYRVVPPTKGQALGVRCVSGDVILTVSVNDELRHRDCAAEGPGTIDVPIVGPGDEIVIGVGLSMTATHPFTAYVISTGFGPVIAG